MLTIEQLKRLRYDPYAKTEPKEKILEELGNPSDDAIFEAALTHFKNSDRNVRVAMLRVVADMKGEKGAEVILMGLKDEKRRVREVAAKCCGNYLSDSKILQRLKEMAEDETEKTKIKSKAYGSFVSAVAQGRCSLEVASPKGLFENERYRGAMLGMLLGQELTEKTEELLREFVKNGTKEEAVAATKALCGYRVINLGSIDDPKERKTIERTADLAFGRVCYWVKR